MVSGAADGVRWRFRHKACRQTLADWETDTAMGASHGRCGTLINLPVFLKFGGIDAEFLWMRTRIRRGIYRFSVAEFTDFAYESVACYGRFLDALANLMDRRLLRICAAYPAVLDDANWAAGFLSIQRASDQDHLASKLKKTEIPDRSMRTHLRRL